MSLYAYMNSSWTDNSAYGEGLEGGRDGVEGINSGKSEDICNTCNNIDNFFKQKNKSIIYNRICLVISAKEKK